MRVTTPILCAAALVAALLVGCGGNDRCATDRDCAAGAACGADGACQARPCTGNRECPLGSVCEAGACAPGCHSSADCPGDAVCTPDRDGPGQCVGCRGDADCPDQHRCIDQACRQECREDATCATGHCDQASAWCVECTEDPHCPAGEVCGEERCVPGCVDDSRCPATAPRCAADRGDGGVCVQCRDDADCAVGTCDSDGRCVAPAAPPALDILVVVDNSNSMLPNQELLTAGFPAFIEELEARAGIRPDLHIGITSTDMGAVNGTAANCDGVGDAGKLLKRDECTLTDGVFLRDVGVPGGLRDVNYTGSLAESFTCLASLGVEGCGFEQTLDAVRAALTPETNPGFRRPDAGLVVIILTNEDDCSSSDPALYGREETGPFGPLHSFRCFEFGIRCEPDQPRELGDKTGCVMRTDGPLRPVDQYVMFLRDLVPSNRLVVGLIAGPASPVEVAIDPDRRPPAPTAYTLVPSCQAPSAGREPIEADPAIRLRAFASAFGSRAVVSSACDDHAGPLRSMAAAAATIAR